MFTQSHSICRATATALLFLPIFAQGDTLYSFGNPTAEEQAYIEFINRARANPTAEGLLLAAATDPAITGSYSYFGVDLAMMKSEMADIPAAPPLAPNAQLTTAARGHSQWMLTKATQSHYQDNPYNDPDGRVLAAGYDAWYVAENVAAETTNPWHGHAAFEVDWGFDEGGMQNPRGHRDSIHDPTLVEIGVGVVKGTNSGANGKAGPQVVTQDFAMPWDGQDFGTGVAYYDLNGNNFYDVGEGIAGLNVSMSGVTYYCTSAIGGGWALPVPSSAATRTVTFSGLGINQTRSLVIPANKNAKVDLKLAYSAPAITSAATATDGVSHTLTFTGTAGATGYKLNRWTVEAAAAAESCDSVANMTAAISTSTGPSYSVVSTTVKHSGTGSFHLVNSGTSTSTSQSLEFKNLFRGQTTPVMKFQSRLRSTFPNEKFRVQVKEEGTSAWLDVYTQNGGTAAEGTFSEKTVDLTGMGNKKFRVRFISSFSAGSLYGAGDGVGWFIDTISFTGVSGLTNNVVETLAGTTKTFTAAAGNYLLSVSPVISGIDFPGGDQFFTVSGAPASGYAAWAGPIESTNSLAAGTLANSPNGDHDKDGRSNLLEYAFGTSPVSTNDTMVRLPAIQAGAGFKVRYVKDATLTDLTLTAVASNDLATWKAPGDAGAPAGFTDSLVSTAGNLQTREVTIPASAGAGWFVRVRVVKP